MPCHVYFDGEILRLDFVTDVTERDFADMIPFMEQLEQSRPQAPHRIVDLSRTSGMNVGFQPIFSGTSEDDAHFPMRSSPPSSPRNGCTWGWPGCSKR